jgi:drug/metabolite transporter (DMT)-like permease
MSSRVLAALVAASIGWGLAGVGTRAAFGAGATTLTVAIARTFVAAAAITVYALVVRVRIDATAWRHGSLIGVLRVGAAPLFFIASLQYISAGVEGLIITLIPATTSALAAFTLGETLRGRQIAGLAIGLAGTTLIIVSGETGLGSGEGNALVGGALALGGVIAGSTSGVLARKYAPQHRTETLAVPMFVSGAAVVAFLGWFSGDVETSDLGPEVWLLLIALGLGSTLLPFGATLFASRHTTAAMVALTGYAAPLVGVVAGVLLLDEELTLPIVVGGALTMFGVGLVGARRRRAVPRPESAT